MMVQCALLKCRDLPDIRFRLAGYPAIFSNPVPVPAKTVPGTGYLSRIVLCPFWQLVELSSPDANTRVSAFKLQRTSESCRPTVLHILVVDLCSV